MQNVNTSSMFRGHWCGLILALGLMLSSCADTSPTSILDPFFIVDRVIPRAALPGSFVTIYGENFYHDTTKLRVMVAGVQAKILSLNPYKIVITVPENARGQDIEVIRDREQAVVGRKVRTAFQVIDSPYRFNIYEVDMDGVMGVTAYSYSSDDGYNKSWIDTTELDILHRQADHSGPDGSFCKEYTNGDTIRMCIALPASGSGRDQFAMEAVVDSARSLITRLEFSQSWLWGTYQSPSQNESKTGGRRVIFRDLPYTRLADSSLQVDLTGSHIFDYIVAYESSFATSTVNANGWSNSTGAVRKLIGASDGARFKFRLYRLR